MADEVAIAKDSLDALSVIFELGSTLSQIAGVISFSGPLAAAFSVVGAILGLIGGFLPDVKHQELLGRFDQLGNKIDLVRNDIEKLKNDVIWETAVLQYADNEGDIMLGMQYCLAIAKASGKDERMRYQQRLQDLCANEKCTGALIALLDGVTGNGIFNGRILDKLYDKTGGDRRKISALGTRLLQLVSGGMMAISTYETMIHGKEGAEDFTKVYYRRLKEASDKVQLVINRCVNDFRGNMLNDLNKILDEGGSNKGLLTKITNLMSDKYDWLENFVLVYNDLYGPDKHCLGGDQVTSLHRNGKCGIVFYRTKGEPPRFSNRYDEAKKIAGDGKCGVDIIGRRNAGKCYNSIVAKVNARGIGWTGCAVIRSGSGILHESTFSTKTVFVCGKQHTTILLLQ